MIFGSSFREGISHEMDVLLPTTRWLRRNARGDSPIRIENESGLADVPAGWTTMTTQEHAIVTGGAGFVGSHLTESLLDDGVAVTVLDNFSSGREGNLTQLAGREGLHLVEHDVRDPFPEVESVDAVYHLASRASPTDFDSYPVDIATTNSIGSHNAFEFARSSDATVVLASTSEVYGDPEEHPQHEGYNGNVDIRGERAPYDEGKRFSEALATAYHTQYDLDVRTVRIFNTYGPRMRANDGRVVPTFLTQALAGDDLTVHGEGQQTRCFSYVSDLVRALRAYAGAPEEAAAGEVINLGSTDEVTIQHLAETVVDLVETDSEITHVGRPVDDPQVRRPDISRARDLLGWEPEVPLRDGLERTLAYFEETG